MCQLFSKSLILQCAFIAFTTVFATQETTLKHDFNTSCAIESETFSWTIERFNFISSMGDLKSPTFIFCFEDSENKRKCTDWHVDMEKGSNRQSMEHLDITFNPHENSEHIWINVRLYDLRGTEVRTIWDWRGHRRNLLFRFPFDTANRHDVKLNNLPNDVLVIKWEMIRVDPEKDILTV